MEDDYIMKIIDKPLEQKTPKELAMIEAIVEVSHNLPLNIPLIAEQ